MSRTRNCNIPTLRPQTSTADAGSIVSAGCSDFASGNSNSIALAIVTPSVTHSTTNACSAVSSDCNDNATTDGDILTCAIIANPTHTAADASATISSGRGDFAATDGDILTGATFVIAALTAADASAVLSAGGGDFAAFDGNTFAITFIPTADAGTILSASSFQAASILFIFIIIITINRQGACIFLLQPGAVFPASNITVTFQLDVHIAFAPCYYSRSTILVRDIDNQVPKGHIGFSIRIRINRDGVFPRPTGDHRFRIRHCRFLPMLDRLGVFRRKHSYVALGDIIRSRQRIPERHHKHKQQGDSCPESLHVLHILKPPYSIQFLQRV